MGIPPLSSKFFASILEKISRYPDRVIFKGEKLDERRKLWRNYLVGKFLVKPPPLHVLHLILPKLWFLLLDIVDMANGFFLFKFDYEDEALTVLTNGPWTIQGHGLSLVPSKPDF